MRVDLALMDPPLSAPLLATSVLLAKYRLTCARGTGDPRTYLSPENEIASLSLVCDALIQATTDDQPGDVGPYAVLDSGP
jgi:hypothetical protein